MLLEEEFGNQSLYGLRADAERPDAHGHGLRLARQVADQLSLESGPAGTRATVIFALR